LDAVKHDLIHRQLASRRAASSDVRKRSSAQQSLVLQTFRPLRIEETCCQMARIGNNQKQ
jgi:hypothetical protein